MITFWPEEFKDGWVMVVKNISILIFGFVGFLAGTGVTIQKIIELSTNPNPAHSE